MMRTAGFPSRLFLILSALCLLGHLLPFPLGAAEIAVPKPSAKDKCPVCGMFVAKYPDWLAAVRFRDGSHVFFDGAKDMFKYLHDQKRYDPVRKPGDIQAVAVMDYYGLDLDRCPEGLVRPGQRCVRPHGQGTDSPGEGSRCAGVHEGPQGSKNHQIL